MLPRCCRAHIIMHNKYNDLYVFESDSVLFCTIRDYCLWPWCFCCCYEGTVILFDCSTCEAAKMNQIILNKDEFTERLYGCESSCDICVCMNSISLTFRTLWENRNEYCVSFSWSSCSNLSSSLCLVSICPLPANLPQEWWQARAWHKSTREGRLFIFDFINNLLLWIYNTPKDETASSYESAVRNTTRNCKIKKKRRTRRWAYQTILEGGYLRARYNSQ